MLIFCDALGTKSQATTIVLGFLIQTIGLEHASEALPRRCTQPTE